MINWKKNLFFISLTQFLSALGFALALPLIAEYIRVNWCIKDEHTINVWASQFKFVSLLGLLIFTPIWGVLADRFGRKLMLLRTCYTSAILYPCFLFVPNLYSLVALRFVASAFSGTVAAAQSITISTTPKEEHRHALGMLYSMMYAGNLMGFATGGLVLHYFGFTVLFVTCGLIYLISGVLAHINITENFQPLVKRGSKAQKSTQRTKNLPVFTSSVLAILALILIVSLAGKFDEPYTVTMIQHINGVENSMIYTSLVNTLAALGGTISGLMTVKLCKVFSPTYLVIPVLLLASGFATIMQSYSLSLNSYIISRFLFFMFSGGLEMFFISLLSTASETCHCGALTGIALSVKSFGQLLATQISILIDKQWGISSVYFFPGIIFMLLIPLCICIIRSCDNRTAGRRQQTAL